MLSDDGLVDLGRGSRRLLHRNGVLARLRRIGIVQGGVERGLLPLGLGGNVLDFVAGSCSCI